MSPVGFCLLFVVWSLILRVIEAAEWGKGFDCVFATSRIFSIPLGFFLFYFVF